MHTRLCMLPESLDELGGAQLRVSQYMNSYSCNGLIQAILFIYCEEPDRHQAQNFQGASHSRGIYWLVAHF